MFKKIYIEITNICNLKCKFCPDTSRKKAFMSAEDFEKIIEKVQKHTELVCLHVKGEPLLHPELDKILEIIKKYNLKANITTNGTLICENLETLKRNGKEKFPIKLSNLLNDNYLVNFSFKLLIIYNN